MFKACIYEHLICWQWPSTSIKVTQSYMKWFEITQSMLLASSRPVRLIGSEQECFQAWVLTFYHNWPVSVTLTSCWGKWKQYFLLSLVKHYSHAKYSVSKRYWLLGNSSWRNSCQLCLWQHLRLFTIARLHDVTVWNNHECNISSH